MSRVVIDVPERSSLALRVAPADAGRELRLAAAMKLFEMGRVSSGAAAELAGIPKPLFLSKLADYGIPAISLSDDELKQDSQAAVC